MCGIVGRGFYEEEMGGRRRRRRRKYGECQWEIRESAIANGEKHSGFYIKVEMRFALVWLVPSSFFFFAALYFKINLIK